MIIVLDIIYKPINSVIKMNFFQLLNLPNHFYSVPKTRLYLFNYDLATLFKKIKF